MEEKKPEKILAKRNGKWVLVDRLAKEYSKGCYGSKPRPKSCQDQGK